ncbi:Peptidyl-prolyl cis-trans isomerase NIMA-interacting protein 1 [Clydaea vesicula]|uniref:Peptidyl-prolyl cis-trans isomerase n=1 Tax=Clydaea vesicula TaxID=447962 RepID=A0AAD5U4M2_9FUNG|nr:Peptidyl-prolyl cis-trans isomerase NIMA-interacting protein 1 [Clydaea vesicula]KAJ3384043.1 Peptidyl-prolyl cis-trans isomerase NIMA-interacting protein 1 [Lobulomyces angularis]
MSTEEVVSLSADTYEERWSNSNNKVYYLNLSNNQSQWEKPTEYKELILLKVYPVRASHLLVKHNQSRRPSSWKQAEITRTKEEALEIISAFRKKITEENVDFASLASVESDCSSAKNGGDLGYFGGPSKVKMQEEFDRATFALEVGQLSEPVESASGIHLILSELVKLGLAEYEDNRDKEIIFIYWKKPNEWADLIYKWVFDNGLVNTICTVFELIHGENTEGEEFHNLDERIMKKALNILNKNGKAQIFSGSNPEELGVKFY